MLMEGTNEQAGCDDSSELESEEVCHAITMKAIPPCMLMEGTNEQAKCLADAAQDIEEELGIDEEGGAEVVAKCKCDAFKKISEALSSVRDMMCPPSDSDRKPRNYYGYGANTLWFQYILCQQESIPSLACWLFTSGWNQAEFGQYYLYDNLLNSEEGGLLDGDLLPILALSGGLGGGLGGGSYAPAHGGHPVYRRSACEDNQWMTADGCMPKPTSRKRRSDSSACKKGEVLTPSGCKLHFPKPTSRKRRSDCEDGDEGCDVNSPSRKRRSDCDEDDTVEECNRKRRSVPVCDKDDSAEECNRKRRSVPVSVCDKDEVWTAQGCVDKPSRKRRSSDPPKCKNDEVLAPSGCRKRRSASKCIDDEEFC